jgi:2-desacetyl-2-hydroxyethyl bacteriochlorophyllide A dehydrogenase
VTQRNIPNEFHRSATALWTRAPGVLELRDTLLPPPAAGEVCVRTLFSGVSLGTERLVFAGKVPPSEHGRMRAPFQEGEFTFPVKYGYAAVGEIVEGADDRLGELVFVLHPHQSLFNVPAAAAVPLPPGLPAQRALLAANMETALNGLWDAGASAGDHVCVVGAGVVGLLVARLCARLPATQVTLVDIDPARADIARAMGAAFALPGDAPGEQDLVIHASGHPSGLDTALHLAGQEATVLEMSWYGDQKVTATLGGAFHSRRLVLKSSQVGQLPATRQARWTYRRRLETALSLLRDDALDKLLEAPIALQRAADELPEILSGRRRVLAQPILHAPLADPLLPETANARR